jgi:hypothetical protein
MTAKEIDRKVMTRKVMAGGFGWPSPNSMPKGYGYADRLIDIGEEVYIYEGKEWVKVVARSAHDWWGKDRLKSGFSHAPRESLGGFSFIDPFTGELNYYSSLHIKEKWVEDRDAPHGGRHVTIGLHDPNPYVCIKTDGNNPMELDEKGLPYYPLTGEQAEKHHEGNTESVREH